MIFSFWQKQKFYMKPTPQYFVAVVVSLFAAAWAISGIGRSIIRPTISPDAEAYAELSFAAKSGLYSEIESQASKAYSKASDPDIRKFSEFLMRHARYAQRAGVSTIEEGGSFTGFGKSFVIGFLNPLHGLEGLTMSIEVLWNDYNTIASQLDKRYYGVFRRYEFAETCGTVIWWVCLIGGVWAYISFRKEFEPTLLATVAPFAFLGLQEPVEIHKRIGSKAPTATRKSKKPTKRMATQTSPSVSDDPP
ncbi:MAG: hypothetical protein ABL974_15985 [Prosthecobacter sp.]